MLDYLCEAMVCYVLKVAVISADVHVSLRLEWLSCFLEVDTDDNLHDVINHSLHHIHQDG